MSTEHSDPPRPRTYRSNDAPQSIKYYFHDDKFDTWKVYFANNAALAIAKVEAFFSKYGEIVKIDQSPSSAFCFVHFKREEDAKTCAFATRDSSTIRLRPFRQTNDRQGRQNNSSQSRQSFDKTGENGKSAAAAKASVADRLKVRDKVPDGEAVQESCDTSATSRPPRSYELYSSTSASTESIPIDPKGSSAHRRSSPSNELPELVQRTSIGCPMKVVQPFAPSITWPRPHLPIVQHITLQDVVVANIHEFCDVDFILDMLEHFHPVCASNMEVIVEKSLRYCYVYFETPEQARAVEDTYDNAELYGKSLIVQRPESLAANAERLS